jgi:hypothetical protein
MQDITAVDAVSLSFRYTESEYRDAVRRHFSRVLKPRRDLAAAIIGLCAGSAMLVTHVGPAWIAGALLAVAVILLLVVAVALLWMPGYWWRSQPRLRDDFHLVFSDTGIVFRSGTIDSKIGWNHYDRVVADERWYFLYYGAGFTALPRRAFADDAAEHRFVALTGAHIAPPARQ